MSRNAWGKRSNRPRLLVLVLCAVVVGLVAATSPGRTSAVAAATHQPRQSHSPARPRALTDLDLAFRNIRIAVGLEHDALSELKDRPKAVNGSLAISRSSLFLAKSYIKDDVKALDLAAGDAASLTRDITAASVDDSSALALQTKKPTLTLELVERALALKTRALHKISELEKKKPKPVPTPTPACSATIAAGPPQPPLVGHDLTLTCNGLLDSFSLQLNGQLVTGTQPAGTSNKTYDQATNTATFFGPWAAGTTISFSVYVLQPVCPGQMIILSHIHQATAGVSGPIVVDPCK